MKPIYTLIFTALFSTIYGQKINIDPCALFKEAMVHKNIDTLDYYLNMDTAQLDIKDRINLMTFKGAVLIRKHKGKNRKRKLVSPSIIDSSYHLFRDAINLVEDENLKIGYRFRMYETLSELEPKYKGMLTDKKDLEKHGYKKDESGVSAYLVSKSDGDFWIGAEVAIFGRLRNPFNLKDGYEHTIKQSKYGRSASVLIFSYLRNIEANISESKFSIFKVEAPLYIDITQVGCIKFLDKLHWFYRPELGVGYGRFSLSYGFNFFFKKASVDIFPRHSLNFHTKFVF